MKTRFWDPKYFKRDVNRGSFRDALNKLAADREKRLDKVDDLLYNIHTRVVDMNYIEVDPYSFTKNTERTLVQVNLLSDVEKVLKQVNAEQGKDAFIAGGLVRDTLLGVDYNDVDIFLPLAEDEDPDDEAVWYTEGLRRFDPVLYNRAAKKKGEMYKSSNFTCYEMASQDRFLPHPIQVIARVGPKSPEDICNTFDSELVKCYYKDGKFFVCDLFPDIVKRNRVVAKAEKEYYRLRDWRNRTGYKITIGKGYKPSASSKTDIYPGMTSDSYATYGQVLNQFVVMGDGPDAF
jgi:hypothetical protein